MYRPLPKTLTIKDSPIHGQGLYATERIPNGTDLGISHIFAVWFKYSYIRTPLGGFVNHSYTPNSYKVQSHDDSALNYYYLYTTRDIEEGEELTLNYTLYSI